MQNISQAKPCLLKTHFDTICYNRLKALNFAQPQYKIARLISKIKGGAK